MTTMFHSNPSWLTDVEWKKSRHDVADAVDSLKIGIEYVKKKQFSHEEMFNTIELILPKLEQAYGKIFLKK